MEKYIIIILLFFFNSVIGQKIKVVDSQNDPIYNVADYKRNLEEAILWHGGEAKASRQAYTQLPEPMQQLFQTHMDILNLNL